MSATKFIEIVGNASTTAWLNGKRLGHNVNAAAYQGEGETVIIKLESNGTPVRGISPMVMTGDEYAAFRAKQDRDLMLRGLDLFGCETAWPSHD